ncbi:MAG TPA: CPBP family intramembrane glutamic endopeptidase [Bryobacteraceae bacterium]|nr:CPBP family intramembrane glutamic endopeptidase [Bryobacteraceae bacterium]
MIAALVLLAVILCLLIPSVQNAAQALLNSDRKRTIIVALVLSCLLLGEAARLYALSPGLAVLVFAYTLAPVLILYGQRPGSGASWRDLTAMLVLWLPLEFAVGANLVPKAAQGQLHAAAYGVAITLALTLFLLARRLPGMKYNLPLWAADFRNAVVGFAVAIPLLIPLGLWLGFLAPMHAMHFTVTGLLWRMAVIFAGTALPEEILFRSLIQNWVMQRLGPSRLVSAIVISGLIFGCAHLDNGPQALPNWRYGILASLAGMLFGAVFAKSNSVVVSALVHMAVDTTKHAWF